MLHRFVIIAMVSVAALLSPCGAAVILQTTRDALYKVANVMGDVEKGLEPSLHEIIATVGDLIHNTTDKYSLQNIQEVFSECLQDCWLHLLDEEALERCVYEKRESCELLNNYTNKELVPYFSALKVGSKIVKVPEKAVGAAFGLENTEDREISMSNRAVNAGFKLIETAAVEKMTEEFFDSGKEKLLGFIQSFGMATNDLGNGIRSGKNTLEEMVNSGKKLSEADEAEQLKNAIENGKNVVETALRSSKNVAKSISTLPIKSAIETGNYAIDSVLSSGYSIVKSDDAAQFKSAIEDGKDAATSLINSGVKLTETVKSIPKQIVTGAINCTAKDGSGSILAASEENEKVQHSLVNGFNAMGTLIRSSLKLAESLSELPLKTAMDVGNFAVDSIIESGLKIAKSDEAMLLNSAVFAGKDTTVSMVGSGKKLVETAVDIPLKTASDIKTVALETIVATTSPKSHVQ